MNKIVTKLVLDMYDKYDQDLSLLNEPWAKKKDVQLVSFEQATILGKYIDKLEFTNSAFISKDLKEKIIKEIEQLELFIEKDVIEEIKRRIVK